jgi:uncharacterized protein YraI
MPGGSVVELTGESASGFLGVIYQGTAGWASATYLSTGSSGPTGSTATVIDGALNLRSGPGTSYGVLLVLPDGAVVTLDGGGQDGFLGVTYNGVSGWAYGEFLV